MLAGQWPGGWFPSLFSQRRGRIGTTGLWAEGLECTIVSRCPSMAPPGGTGATLMASGPTGASWVNSSLGGAGQGLDFISNPFFSFSPITQ